MNHDPPNRMQPRYPFHLFTTCPVYVKIARVKVFEYHKIRTFQNEAYGVYKRKIRTGGEGHALIATPKRSR